MLDVSASPNRIRVKDIVTPGGCEHVLEDTKGWLLIRFSGTEPVIRARCETTDETKVEPLLQERLELAGLA